MFNCPKMQGIILQKIKLIGLFKQDKKPKKSIKEYGELKIIISKL